MKSLSSIPLNIGYVHAVWSRIIFHLLVPGACPDDTLTLSWMSSARAFLSTVLQFPFKGSLGRQAAGKQLQSAPKGSTQLKELGLQGADTIKYIYTALVFCLLKCFIFRIVNCFLWVLKLKSSKGLFLSVYKFNY